MRRRHVSTHRMRRAAAVMLQVGGPTRGELPRRMIN
jgi:hypothetical protein